MCKQEVGKDTGGDRLHACEVTRQLRIYTQAAINMDVWIRSRATRVLTEHTGEVLQISKKLLFFYLPAKSVFFILKDVANGKSALKANALSYIFLELSSFLSAVLSAYL